jgi:hypothetical protein
MCNMVSNKINLVTNITSLQKKNPEREDGICIFVFFFQIFGLLTGWNFTIIVLHSCVYVKYICTHFIILIKLFYIGVNALE